MALYSKSQFADLCGCSMAKVSMGVKRGQIVMRGDWIDDTIEKNAQLRERWQEQAAAKLADKQIEAARESTPEPSKAAKKSTSKPLPAFDIPPVKGEILPPAPKVPSLDQQVAASGGESINDLDKQKKRAEIEFKETQTRLAQLKEAKLRGENIPTDMVLNVVSMLGHAFQSSYKNGAHILLMELSHRVKMSAEVEAEFKGKLIELINKSHRNAIAGSKQAIKSILSDVSESEVMMDDNEEK